MRRSKTVRLDDAADAQSDDEWQRHGDESDGVPGSTARGQRPKARWWRRVLLVLATLMLAALVASASLALSTYVFASHQPGQAGLATSTATTTTAPATPAPTATATPHISRISMTNVPPPPPCIPSGSHPLGVISGTSAKGEVALTFDDGPTPDSTPAILNVLEQTHTAATFFVLGQYVTASPYLLQREANDGFAIGIHTWDHPDMTTLSPSQQFWQLSATQQAIRNVLGASTCPWFWRPPYGSYNQQVLQTAAQVHLTTITWDDDPADWSQPGVTTIVQRVLSEVHAGSIVLMHDGPAFRQQTADALPQILAGLKTRGLRPVTIPQVLADGGYAHAAVPSTTTATTAITSTNAAITMPAGNALHASPLAGDLTLQPLLVLARYRSVLALDHLPGEQPSLMPPCLIQPRREPLGDIGEAGLSDGMWHVVFAIRQGDGQSRKGILTGATVRDG